MYFREYIWFAVAIMVCMLFAGVASNRVKTTFSKYNKINCLSGCTGYNTIARLMRSNRINDIAIGRVNGFLSDHYHPTKKVVNLSESTYDNNSVAAVAVAAHEMGHVMQSKEGYAFYRLRTALVPVVNFGSRLAMPLVLVGLLLDLYSISTTPEIGFKIAMVGVILYGSSLLFALVTLPVELNASKRASKMLLDEGILTAEELPAAKKMLSAAATTYLASLITTLVYFLRFLLHVLAIFGRKNNNRY